MLLLLIIEIEKIDDRKRAPIGLICLNLAQFREVNDAAG